MSAEIIPFPKQNKTPVEEINEYIRAYLFELTGDMDFINHVSSRMSAFITEYASKSFEPIFTLAAPPNMSQEQAYALLLSVEKGIQETSAEVQEMVRKIIVERLHLEIEIYTSQKTTNYHLL